MRAISLQPGSIPSQALLQKSAILDARTDGIYSGAAASSPLSHTEMRPVCGLAPPLSASVITIWRHSVLCCVALRALSMSSEMAYGSGDRPCATPTHHYQLRGKAGGRG